VIEVGPPSAAEWAAELESRQAAARTLVGSSDADALLVYGSDAHAEPFRWLTNFQPVMGSAWLLLPLEGDPFCALDFAWQLEEARRRSGIADWYGATGPVGAVVDALRDRGIRRPAFVGFDRVSVSDWRRLGEVVGPESDVLDLGGELATLRRRKSPLELRCLRAAGRVTDDALTAVRAQVRIGMTEREIAARLGYELRRASGEWAFTPIAITGVDDPIAIREPTDRRVELGDAIMLDVGGSWDGYQADASRTWVMGEPSRLQRDVWDVIERAYAASLAMVRPGVPCRDVSAAAIEIVHAAGYELGHRIGHGIGLATSFEWPSLDHDATPLEPGMTSCLEPGVYLAGAGNLKLEDDVAVTADGYELLTNCDRSLALVPA
jgi:Xaa-Pro aminopeptidase